MPLPFLASLNVLGLWSFVDCSLQLRAWSKRRRFAGWNLNWVAGLRVTTFTSGAMGNPERTKPGNGDLFA